MQSGVSEDSRTDFDLEPVTDFPSHSSERAKVDKHDSWSETLVVNRSSCVCEPTNTESIEYDSKTRNYIPGCFRACSRTIAMLLQNAIASERKSSEILLDRFLGWKRLGDVS